MFLEYVSYRFVCDICHVAHTVDTKYSGVPDGWQKVNWINSNGKKVSDVCDVCTERLINGEISVVALMPEGE